MNTDRAIVVVSLVYVGALVALSRSWLGDIRASVQKATGKAAGATAIPGGDGQAKTERAVVVEFLVGYGVLWLVLTAMTEVEATSGTAAALAVAIASGASVLFLADAAANIGLTSATTEVQ